MSRDSIRFALDSFSEESSQTISVNVIAPAGGKIITLLPVTEAAAQLRPEVTIQRGSDLTMPFLILMKSSYVAVLRFQYAVVFARRHAACVS